MATRVTPIVWSKLLNRTKNRTPGHVLIATMAYVHTQLRICVTIFSTSGKFQPVSNCTELHALT